MEKCRKKFNQLNKCRSRLMKFNKILNRRLRTPKKLLSKKYCKSSQRNKILRNKRNQLKMDNLQKTLMIQSKSHQLIKLKNRKMTNLAKNALKIKMIQVKRMVKQWRRLIKNLLSLQVKNQPKNKLVNQKRKLRRTTLLKMLKKVSNL